MKQRLRCALVAGIVSVIGGYGVQAMRDNSDQNAPVDPAQAHLRPPPPQVSDEPSILVLTPAFRDGARCGKTLLSALMNADHPELLRFSIYDQVLSQDITCLDAYCKLAKEQGFHRPKSSADSASDCPYAASIHSVVVDAQKSRGPMVARAHLQKTVTVEEENGFCLSIDSHSLFAQHWDSELLRQWTSTENEMAVLSAYPPSIDLMGTSSSKSYYMCEVTMAMDGVGQGFVRMVGPRRLETALPLLQPYWGAGFSFSKCHTERRVPIDPLTDWVFDGEEFSRAVNLWTNGYDLYGPKSMPIFHNYTRVPHNVYEIYVKDDVEKNVANGAKAMNRLKLNFDFPFEGVVNTTDIRLYEPGAIRSYSAYKAFSGVDVQHPSQSKSQCDRQLHWVPYEDPKPIEELVAGWRFDSRSVPTGLEDDMDNELEADVGRLTTSVTTAELAEERQTEEEKSNWSVAIMGLGIVGVILALASYLNKLDRRNKNLSLLFNAGSLEAKMRYLFQRDDLLKPTGSIV